MPKWILGGARYNRQVVEDYISGVVVSVQASARIKSGPPGVSFVLEQAGPGLFFVRYKDLVVARVEDKSADPGIFLVEPETTFTVSSFLRLGAMKFALRYMLSCGKTIQTPARLGTAAVYTIRHFCIDEPETFGMCARQIIDSSFFDDHPLWKTVEPILIQRKENGI